MADRRQLLQAIVLTFACASVMVLPVRPRAQTPPQVTTDEARLQALGTTAQKAYDARHWDDAAAAFQALLEEARRQHVDLWEGRALLGIGRAAEARARYAEARSNALEALTILDRLHATKDLARAYYLLGSVANETGHDAEATARYGQAAAAYEASGDTEMRLWSLFGQLHTSSGPDSERWQQFQALEDLAHASGNKSFEGRLLHTWSDDLFIRNDYEGALDKLQAASAVLEQSDDFDELGTVYNSMGRIFRVHGRYAAALQCQLKALAIHEQHGSPRTLIQSLNAVAVTYQTLNDKANGEKYFSRALALATEAGDKTILSFLRANYADFLADFGEPAKARAMMLDALVDATPIYLHVRYLQLSEFDLAMKNGRQALEDADKSLALCNGGGDLDCLQARVRRADAQLMLGNEAAALDDQQIALKGLEDIHGKLAASDFLKQGFQNFWLPAYSVAIALHLHRGEVGPALEDAELARSRALLDLLASRAVGRPTPKPGATLAGTSVADAAPNVAAASSATIPELTASAARLHSTMLFYWVADTRVDEWVLSPGGDLHSATVPIDRRQLDGWIQATSAFLQTSSAGSSTRTRGGQEMSVVMKPQAAWSDLYDVLIKPIASYLPAEPGSLLTIVPHGPLLDVPFAALRDRQGRYLIERYAIHSVPAGGLLSYTAASRHANARAGNVLLVADPARPPAMAGEPPLPRLPGAESEVRSIAALLPASRTTVLSGENATEARVLGTTSKRSVLHFATHALAEDADPLASFLALSRASGASAGGRLTAEEIYNLRLDADLVVLSACRSGGAITNGDGVAALARAFFYAGAPSLVVSLWDVADQPTNQLLPAFYRAWLRGADKARALRSAQLKLIDDLRAGRVVVHTSAGDLVLPESPAFWAGFVLLGEPD